MIIDTLLKLWPLITATLGGTFYFVRWIWQRHSVTRTAALTRQERAEEVARLALVAAQAKTDAATADHIDWLEKELARTQSALEVARASEVEAWRRARHDGRESS